MAQWLDRIKFGNGSNGAPSSITNYFNTFTGTSGQTSGTISAGWVWDAPVLIHQSQGTGAGQWELNWGTVSSGTTITLKYPLSYTYGTGAQIVTLHQYTGGTFSGTHTGTAWNGSVGGIVALMCNGDLTISGSINVSGAGFRGGNSRKLNPGLNYCGEGTGGATNLQRTANGNGGGGGEKPQYSQGPGGGGGGNGTAGTNGQGEGTSLPYVGIGGAAVGNAELTNICFGGGGGGGSNDTNIYGGTGGGIVLIVAKTITLSGTITSAGTNGTNNTAGSDKGGGGGGAGGSVLIKTQNATLGTNKITAAAGAGATEYWDGGAGGVGRIHIDYYLGYTGTTTPTIDAAQDTNLKSQVYSGMI